MPEFLSFLAGLLLGAIGGFLVYRNNKARFADTEQELRDAQLVINSLRKQLANVIKG